MAEAEAVVVGAINHDTIYLVDHFPADGETILGEAIVADGGKGANQAVVLAQLGVSTALVGKVGDDQVGTGLVERLEAAGVSTGHVRKVPGTVSGRGCVWSTQAGGKHIVIAPGANLSLAEAAIHSAKDAIARASVLLLQLEVPLSSVETAARLARDNGTKVVVNLTPISQEGERFLGLADFVIVNRHECRQLVEYSRLGGKDLNEAAARLAAHWNNTLIVTLGSEGALVVTRHGWTPVEPIPCRLVDSTGAGDAFCGAFVAALVRGFDAASAAKVAAIAGAVCAQYPGARIPEDGRREMVAEIEKRLYS